jgi:hypothetical protein
MLMPQEQITVDWVVLSGLIRRYKEPFGPMEYGVSFMFNIPQILHGKICSFEIKSRFVFLYLPNSIR